jgi:hypothetical protein
MKKYLLFAFLSAIGLNGFAQIKPIYERTKASSTNTMSDAYLRAALSLYIPMGATPIDSAHLGLAAIFYKIDPITHETSFWILNPWTHAFERYAKNSDTWQKQDTISTLATKSDILAKSDTGSVVHRTGNKTETVTGKKNFTGVVGFSGTTSIDAAGFVTNGIRRYNNSLPFNIIAPSNPVLNNSIVIQPAYPGSDTTLRRITSGKNKALVLIRDSLIINDTYVADHAAVKVEGAIIQSGSSTGKTAAFWGKLRTITATDYATFRDSTSAAQGYALKFEGDAPSLTNGTFYGVTESTTDSTRKFTTTALLHQVIGSLSPGRITYTSGTGTSNVFTSTALVNCFVEGVWRDGVEYMLTGSSSPNGNKAYVNTTTGAVTFQDNITSSEYIVIRYRGIQGVSTLGGSLRFISTSSYSDMTAQLSGNTVKVFYVQSDEVNGGGYPTEYIYYNGQLIRNIPQLAN